MRKFYPQGQMSKQEQGRENWTNVKYFQFRYANGSYKAQKIAVKPLLIEAKCGNEKIMLYNTGELKSIQLSALKGKLSYWKQIERERSRALKIASKKGKRTVYSLVTES
jgi:hypothetical protein